MRHNVYDRQRSLTLKNYRYLIVVGVGGVGNWVALTAALTGLFENIILVDGDTVEETNLNRTIFEETDIGSTKCDAVKYQILKRRHLTNVCCINSITSPEVIDMIIKMAIDDNSYYHHDVVCVDCRDDIYEDLYPLNCKLYKVGYDGMSMTIDGNPRLTKIFTQRGGTYTVTPSFIGSSQLVACLVVNDIVYPPLYQMAQNNENLKELIYKIDRSTSETEEQVYVTDKNYRCKNDEYGRLNGPITFNACDILYNLDSTREKYDLGESIRPVVDESTHYLITKSLKLGSGDTNE